MAKSEAAAEPAKAAKAVYRDGHPQDVIQYLEVKLILKPDPFTSVKSFRGFGRIVQHQDRHGVPAEGKRAAKP